MAVSENERMRSVVLELDLSGVSGTARQLSDNGELSEVEMPSGVSNCSVLLVPAPLPSRLIKSIYFPDLNEKKLFIGDCQDYENVPIDEYVLKTKKILFNKPPTLKWDPLVFGELPELKGDLSVVNSIGGSMAAIFAVANCGSEGVEAVNVLFKTSHQNALSDNGNSRLGSLNPGLRSVLKSWSMQQLDGFAGDTQSKMLVAVLLAILSARAGGGSSDVCIEILEELEAQQQSLEKEEWQHALERLRSDLKGVQGLGNHTFSDLLDRHQKSFSRSLLMFFLRDKPEEIWDFYGDQLNAEDLVIAALLFGARAGWEGLPGQFLGRFDLREAVSYRMARLAQQLNGGGLEFGPASRRPVPLRELIGKVKGRAFNKKQVHALSDLAGKEGWNKAIKTKISFPRGSYEFVIEGGSLHVMMDGQKDITQTLVDRELIIELLARRRVTPALEDKVREAFI